MFPMVKTSPGENSRITVFADEIRGGGWRWGVRGRSGGGGQGEERVGVSLGGSLANRR